mmetsp:Transcript_89944/g.142119  ORF Transcript_89944/g.142119 Transcript_89944/m.142119 type:complete len:1080 (+) Transcript_89944:35-3274(+)
MAKTKTPAKAKQPTDVKAKGKVSVSALGSDASTSKQSADSKSRCKTTTLPLATDLVTKVESQPPQLAHIDKPSRSFSWGPPSTFCGGFAAKQEAQRVARNAISSILNTDANENKENEDANARMLEMYRLSAKQPGVNPDPPTAHPIRQFAENAGWDDCIASELGFPSPFEAINLADKQCILKRDVAEMVRKTLGDMPMSQEREAGVPAGLKNLGATCYMNSLLQYLFFNAPFRSLMLQAESDEPAILELQRVFALLLGGQEKTIDPTKFVDAAAINAGEEADATEFSALLMEFLDSALKGRSSSLFQGEISKVMTCQENHLHQKCKIEKFEELRAGFVPEKDRTPTARATVQQPVEGKMQEGLALLESEKPKPKKSLAAKKKVMLEQLLQETSFSDEIFDGDNKYVCEFCNNRKVVAKQTVHFQKAPPYLHIRFERYKFDFKKATRTKLNTIISFPKDLQFSVCPEGGTASPVIYECVGYLEHVSDSAHSGHYTATLFNEESHAADEVTQPHIVESESAEPPTKKARTDCPRRGSWWKMDDCSVGRVKWVDANTGEAQISNVTPDRITSGSAYLLLYRRRDFDAQRVVEGHGGALPGKMGAFLEDHNGVLQRAQNRYTTQESQLKEFAKHRTAQVQSFLAALEKSPRGTQPSDFLVVPKNWLKDFVRGQDCVMSATDDIFVEMPSAHKKILLPRREDTCQSSDDMQEQAEVLDPLAVWCGEVTFLPKKAMESIGLGSYFTCASDSLSTVAADSLRHLWKTWHAELAILRSLEETRILPSEFNSTALKDAVAKEPYVWISKKYWAKFGRKTTESSISEAAAFKLFLEEASAVRWSTHLGDDTSEQSIADSGTSSPSSGTPKRVGQGQGDVQKSLQDIQRAVHAVSDLLLHDDIVCEHGLVSKPKSAFLARRCLVEELLKVGQEKEQLYRSVWGSSRGTVMLKAQHQEPLLSSCNVCRHCCPEGAASFANSRDQKPSACSIVLDPGQEQKAQHFVLHVPFEEYYTMTGRWLRALASAHVGKELGEMLTRTATGGLRVVQDEDVMDRLPSELRVKLKSVQELAEGGAFQRSVLRVGRNSIAS